MDGRSFDRVVLGHDTNRTVLPTQDEMAAIGCMVQGSIQAGLESRGPLNGPEKPPQGTPLRRPVAGC
ncbi:MAG: hypothetical protein ACRERU_20195 [Methylococcales bacterium]